MSTPVTIDIDEAGHLLGDLATPEDTRGAVVFAHGSGSGRYSRRNRAVAEILQQQGFATLLFDLLTEDEDRELASRFDIGLLAGRLVAAIDQLTSWHLVRDQHVGLFGASTGAAAALHAAVWRPDVVRAVVSRGGRPDLASDAVRAVRAPTLLIVGSLDEQVLVLNRRVAAELVATHRLETIRGATHLFPEPGALEQVAQLAASWFVQHLSVTPPPDSTPPDCSG